MIVRGPIARGLLAALGAGMLLCGCATTRDSLLAVKRIDRNQYEITTHVIGGLSGAEAVQSRDDKIAAQYCAEKGQTMSVVERHGYGGIASQDILTFHCGDSVAKTKSPAIAAASPQPAAVK